MTDLSEDERAGLERAARETGERFGGLEATVEEHASHLGKINGHIETLAEKMSDQATTLAVIGKSVGGIERVLEHKMLSTESRLTVIEAWIAENRGGNQVRVAGRGVSLQWTLALFAGFISLVGVMAAAAVTIVMTIVVLIANNII